jgi:uncharacterized protein (DUF427 family)
VTVHARWQDAIVATSDRTILVEGNHYFPIEDVDGTRLERSEHTTFCPWKGDASYYDVVVDGQRNSNAAWYYPEPYEAAKGIRGYVAFWHGIHVDGANEDEPEIRPPR